VVKRKFPSRIKNVELFLRKLQFTLIHTPSVDILDSDIIIRDKKDYPVMASAIIADVDVLITGDKDFDDVDVERPEIMNIIEFIKSYM
jgi:predicted nucleic acid-binding protein